METMKQICVLSVQLKMDLAGVAGIANGLKNIKNVYQKVPYFLPRVLSFFKVLNLQVLLECG